MIGQERLLKVLLAPHFSEKAVMAADSASQYHFRVVSDATKPEVKAAIESLFNVSVESVNILNKKGKTKIFKGHQGKRKSFKKAIVRLASGQEIDFASGSEVN